ncbi:hypothetical protein LCGC14_1927260 [marine sediment metagenome]|uniref:Uncharacterized protein n=1 Tax=marine sediment metagenome TaxID=412755 RepID=A0A0F9GCB8_9ZZZZ
MEKSEKSRCVKKMFDVNYDFDITLPHSGWNRTMEDIAKAFDREAKDFNDFINQHTNWRGCVHLSVVRDIRDSCSSCGCEWEPYTDEENGELYCAGCGAEVEGEQDG